MHPLLRIKSFPQFLIIRHDLSHNSPETARVIGHKEMRKLVDNNIPYKLMIFLEKPVTELELSSFGKALAPERLVLAQGDLFGRLDAFSREQRKQLVAIVNDHAS